MHDSQPMTTDPSHDDGVLFTAREVADLLDVSVNTVHRMAGDGRLTVARKFPGVTGPRLFRREDIVAAMRAAVEADLKAAG